jgi:hypothetical protein
MNYTLQNKNNFLTNSSRDNQANPRYLCSIKSTPKSNLKSKMWLSLN